MGSEEDSYKNQTYPQNQSKYKFKILLLIILANLLTFYVVTGSYSNLRFPKQLSFPVWDSSALLINLNATQLELVTSRVQIENLSIKLKSTNALVEVLMTRIIQLSGEINTSFVLAKIDDHADMSDEAKLSVRPHKLPLGFRPQLGTNEVHFAIGEGCLRHKEDLLKYMSYELGGECPVDDDSAQKLMLKGCEPLPRRRCHTKSPANYVEPTPLPESLWSIPPDSSIIWEPYTCKSYKCLVERNKYPGNYDCKDCFNLQGREKTRWLFDSDGINYGMDQVLAAKPRGTIRIGLDIGGGSGTFAARMKERNVTIITTSMNFDAPFNNFIASRGLIPMHATISQRFPFFDNTLDIIHSMHILSNWIPDDMLEFTLFDIYRVLRPGGLFWLDRFFCLGQQLNATYIPMFNRVGFRKIRWNVGRKMDNAIDKNEWYLSALLEKPRT